MNNQTKQAPKALTSLIHLKLLQLNHQQQPFRFKRRDRTRSKSPNDQSRRTQLTTDKEQCRQCITHKDTKDAEEQKPNTNQTVKEDQPKEKIRRVDPKEEQPSQPPQQEHLPPMQHLGYHHQQVARYRAQFPILGNIFDDDDDNDDDGMALTNAAVTDWQESVDRKAEILENGLVFINSQNVKKEIPVFAGEIEGIKAIEEWFKLSERMAIHAAWTDEQKLRFFQERMSNLPQTLTTLYQQPKKLITGYGNKQY